MTPFAPLEIRRRRRLTAAFGSLSLTGFAKKVYRVVLNIPLGEVRSYKWVAKKCGSPQAYRAVGAVLRKNPYPLIIPCHRVIKTNKALGDYSFGGRKNKKIILELEKEIALSIAKKRQEYMEFNPTEKRNKVI